MSTERDELAELIRGIDGPATLGGLDVAEAILAAGYRKVETVWEESVTNDGTYEYTSTSDCDGSNVHHLRRKPSVQLAKSYSPWESYSPEASK